MADLLEQPDQESSLNVAELAEKYGISESEFAKIQSKIESIVAEEAPPKPLPDEFRKPRRSGRSFPIVLNIVAIGLTAVGIYLLSRYFSGQEAEIVLESGTTAGAEAQLIEEILRENEERLAAKDQEINQIQSQLSRLDSERAALEANLQAEVEEREAELRAQLANELEAERQRLQDAGQTEAEIAEQLRTLEAEKEAEYARDLEAYRAEAQAELAERQAELESLQDQLQDTLDASQLERQRLVQEAQDREQRVREELGSQIEALEEAEQEAQAQIALLRGQREQEALMTDQVLGSFTEIVQDIQDGNTDRAISGLRSLENLLLDAAGGSDTAERRRRTELALVTTLRGLVQEVDVLRQNLAVRDLTTTDTQQSTLEQQRAAELIQTAADVVELAEAARVAGRYNEARTLYQQALSTIPSLEQVYPGILQLESARRQATIASAVGEATILLGTGGRAESAVATYLTALRELAADENDPLLDMADGIDTAVDQTADELIALQRETESDYRSTIAARDSQIASLNQDLVAARNTITNSQTALAELEREAEDLQEQIDELTATLEERNAALASARQDSADTGDALNQLQTSLATEQARSAGLQTSLTEARAEIDDLENDLSAAEADKRELEAERDTLVAAQAELEAEVTRLENLLETRAEEAATQQESQAQISATTQEQTDGLNAQIATLNTQVTTLQSQISTLNQQIAAAEAERDTARASAREAEETAETLQTELDASAATITSLQEQMAALRATRTEEGADITALEAEVVQLERDLEDLQEEQDALSGLREQYATQLSRAQRYVIRGDYDLARTALLNPFVSGAGAEYFPAIESTIAEILNGLIEDAEETTLGTAREDALSDVVTLAQAIQQNTDDPRGSATVQSLLTRDADLEPVADEMFEIVELSWRAISAQESETSLLGSVSRVARSQIVVERLVDLDVEVGDTVEIRRSLELGQEIPIASGTILEVTDRRVVTSIDEIYQLDKAPEAQDLVYVAQ
jgi:chromosome segregation ATPase